MIVARLRTLAHRISPSAFAWSIVLTAFAAGPPEAAAQLGKVETGEMRLVYLRPTLDYLVPHGARAALNSLEFNRRLYGFEPDDRVTVLLLDFQDLGNAAAGAVPRNMVAMQVGPVPFAFETMAANDRITTLMGHELVHVVTMDQAAGPDRFFRHLFGGKVRAVPQHPETILYGFLTAPRAAAPRWYHEGIAVFVDTWMAGGLGRAQGGYDEMVFRSMVRDGVPFYDPLGLVSEGVKVDFQVEANAYLYGTRFMTWLARRYSPEQVIEWTARNPGSRRYYSAQFRKVFGRSLEDAWAEWVRDEHEFQRRNLEELRKLPITPYRDITKRALGSVSRAFYDPETRSIFAGLNYPGAVAHVSRISVETGEQARLVDIKGPRIYTVTSLLWNPVDRHIYYTTDNTSYRDLVRLDPVTRRTTVLQKDARIGDLAFNAADRTIWGLRSLNGLVTLVRMKPPYTEWERVKTWPYGTVLYDLDISPDGRYLSASFGELTGQQDVRVLDTAALLENEDDTPVVRFDFETATPNGFVFSPDGRYLYGSAYYTGVSNIFRYEIATGKLEAVSNTDTGFFRPVPLADGRLIVFRYSGQGFVPAWIDPKPLDDINPITFLGERLVAEKPVLKDWMLGSPAKIPFEEMEKQIGTYALAGGLRRESFYPIVQGYKDSAAVGLALNLSDPLLLNRLRLAVAFSPDQSLPASERVHLSASYERYDWRAAASLNNADFYDLFGPTKTGRKGYSLMVGRKTTLIFDEPRQLTLDVSGRFAGNLDRLPQYQNVAVDVDKLFTLDASLAYTHVRSSLGHVDDEAGHKWSIDLQTDVVDGEAFPRLHGTYDRGVALPIGHSSVWVRTAAGYSPRDRSLPFANFYFGGFGNNYVDHGDEKRYRHVESFPGAELNEIPGRTFGRVMLEWNLPPWRFRRLGTPGFYATWLRPAVFATALATDVESDRFRRTAVNTGAQVDLRFTVLSNLDMTLSFGGAVAFEDGHAPRREAMVSLKILN